MLPTLEELKKIAEPLNDNDRYPGISAREGELAVTDGRLLLHVWSPEISAIAGSHDSVLDFAPVGSPEMVVGPEWISGPLAEAVHSAWEKARQDQERRQREIVRDLEPEDVQRCPCCGARLVDDCGDLMELEEYVERERSRTAAWHGDAILAMPDVKRIFVASLDYLHTALEVSDRLGGATSLEIPSRANMATFRGDGFFVALAGKLPNWCSPGPLDIRIDIPADAIAKEGGAE